jgi:hypothetical protein
MKMIRGFLAGLVLTGILSIAPNVAFARGGRGGAHFGGGGHFGGFHAGFVARSAGGGHGPVGGGWHRGYGWHGWHDGGPGPFAFDYGIGGYGYLHDYPYQNYYDSDNYDIQATPTPLTSTEVTLSVQKELAQLGYYHGQVDGVIGPETEAAVRWFQSVDELPVTGQINSATLRALRIG